MRQRWGIAAAAGLPRNDVLLFTFGPRWEVPRLHGQRMFLTLFCTPHIHVGHVGVPCEKGSRNGRFVSLVQNDWVLILRGMLKVFFLVGFGGF